MFDELCGCCPQQWEGPASFQRTALYLSISLDCSGISMGPLGQQPNQMQPISFTGRLTLPCLGTKDDQFRLLYCPLIYSRKFLLDYVSTPPPNAPHSICLSPLTLYTTEFFLPSLDPLPENLDNFLNSMVIPKGTHIWEKANIHKWEKKMWCLSFWSMLFT